MEGTRRPSCRTAVVVFAPRRRIIVLPCVVTWQWLGSLPDLPTHVQTSGQTVAFSCSCTEKSPELADGRFDLCEERARMFREITTTETIANHLPEGFKLRCAGR